MKKRFTLYLFAAFVLVCGLTVGAIYAGWGVNAIRYEDSASSIVLCFALSLLFFAAGFFGLMLFSFGKNAYLRTEYGYLEAHYGFNVSLRLSLEEVEDVIFIGSLTRVYTEKKVYNISAPMDEATRERLSKCGKKPWEISKGKEVAAFERAKRAHIVSLVATALFFAMLVLNVLLAKQLTGDARVGELTGREDAIWIAMFFCGLLTVLAAFIAADKSGKLLLEKERRLYRIGSAVGYEGRYENMDKNAVRVIYLDNYRVRVVVKEVLGAYAYDLHIIDALTAVWHTADSDMRESLAEIEELIDVRLGDMPVCEEKLVK